MKEDSKCSSLAQGLLSSASACTVFTMSERSESFRGKAKIFDVISNVRNEDVQK
jgi:hypothetical protein